MGIPDHNENERQHSAVDQIGHEFQSGEHYSGLVYFSLISVIAFDGHVGHKLLVSLSLCLLVFITSAEKSDRCDMIDCSGS